eukprot:200638-Prymnesium_polylepis.1
MDLMTAWSRAAAQTQIIKPRLEAKSSRRRRSQRENKFAVPQAVWDEARKDKALQEAQEARAWLDVWDEAHEEKYLREAEAQGMYEAALREHTWREVARATEEAFWQFHEEQAWREAHQEKARRESGELIGSPRSVMYHSSVGVMEVLAL